MKKARRSKRKWAYWVVFEPGGFEAYIARKDNNWVPPSTMFKGPFWRARYARQYGRSIAYGEAAKARSKAYAFKKGVIKK